MYLESLERRILLSSSDVLTYQDNNARTGADLHEKLLTPQNVNAASFGLRFNLQVDGKVDAQPLYVSKLNIAGRGRHDVLYVATEHDTLYAFDADAGRVLWQTSLLGAGEIPSDPRGCNQVTPEIGITSTPVIDRRSGTIYAVAMSKDAAGDYFQRLHALEIATGAEKLGGPHTITATFPGSGANSTNGTTVFDPAQYKERCALVLSRGVIYTSWASHCDIPEYGSWVMSFDACTLQSRDVLNLTPHGNAGAFWAAGGGPAVDANGNVFLISGNGTFDETLTNSGFPLQGDFGDTFIKLSSRKSLQVGDYFTPFNQADLAARDIDFGSTAPLLLPPMKDAKGQVRQLAVGAGKDAVIYLVDRQHMGKFSADNSRLYQQVTGGVASGVFASPAYFNGKLYYGAVGDTLKAFAFSKARLVQTPASQTSSSFGYPGASPNISANGKKNAIVWVTENTDPALLHAYDANDLSRELYNSGQSGTRDQFGTGNKFITPMVADGKVFVATTNSVGVFGLVR